MNDRQWWFGVGYLWAGGCSLGWFFEASPALAQVAPAGTPAPPEAGQPAAVRPLTTQRQPAQAAAGVPTLTPPPSTPSPMLRTPPRSQTPGIQEGAQPAHVLTELEAVELAVRNNPNLHVALLQYTQAQALVAAEDSLYVPVITAQGGITHARQPGLSRMGDVTISTSDSVDLSAGITQPFSTGTRLTLSLSGQRWLRRSPVSAIDATQLSLGPGYATNAQLSVSQPLLRGAGSNVGEASLRQAKLQKKAANLAAQVTASQLLRDVLQSYWELWYSDEAVRINQASRDLAREQEQQANDKVASGALARSDALAYMTQRAQLEEAVVAATANRWQRGLSLKEFLGQPTQLTSELQTRETPPAMEPLQPDASRAISDALEVSHQLKQLETQIALARDQVQTAGDTLRPKLDLEAYVQVQGLGYQRVPPAFAQTGRLEALSAYVGLAFEMPVTDTRRRAQIQSARLSIHIAEKRLEAARQQLRTQALSAMANRNSAQLRLTLAEETARVAKQQAEAERERFRAGASVAIQVQQAEDAWLQAQLRVQRARVDLVASQVDLDHLRGRLLERYATVLQSVQPARIADRLEVQSGPL
ncbi:TolC family protein [Myxococcota bacterium]